MRTDLTPMPAIEKIDEAKPFLITGCRVSAVDQQTLTASAQIFLPNTAEFLAWLVAKPIWMEAAFGNLQGLRNTDSGAPLLTSWLAHEDFWSMLYEGRGTPVIDDIAIRALHWRSAHFDEVCLDFFKKTPSAAPLIRRT
ncbi:MAG: hypothetical protein DI563_05760 [Variovorax paradoxus]|uniref:Uncharacterized protein n=1 Tax=Variovorax paradoxus TaxID=34073 RepID=A0A2W5QHW2_VARPD|nr:MAG: hypothetical protein DI563_05760 [Variovorax paradoxus]